MWLYKGALPSDPTGVGSRLGVQFASSTNSDDRWNFHDIAGSLFFFNCKHLLPMCKRVSYPSLYKYRCSYRISSTILDYTCSCLVPMLLIDRLSNNSVLSFRIVKAHPAIGHAVMQIAASVNEEGARAGASAGMEGMSKIIFFIFPGYMNYSVLNTVLQMHVPCCNLHAPMERCCCHNLHFLFCCIQK